MKRLLQLITIAVCLSLMCSCNQETKSKNILSAAKMLESDFQGKQIAEDNINDVVNEYLASYKNDSLGFEMRYALFSRNYLNKYSALIHHAKSSNRLAVEKLMMSEQMQIFSFRKSFSFGQLDTLSTKEILAIQNEGNFGLGTTDAKFKNLIFYSDHQASGAIQSIFSISPVLFDRESEGWKIDPIGDPLHQKMKEQKLASLQNKSYDAYKKSMQELMEVNDESWIPLQER